jgi:hypothetical protein
MRTITLAAAFALLAAPAFADTPWTAAPVQPSSQSGFVANTVVWNCGASGCVSASETSDADAMDECTGITRQLGPVSSFTAGKEVFDAAHLARCNSVAKKR